MRVIILILLFVIACTEEDKAPQMGCSLGVRIGQEDLGHQFIRCATKEQHAAGNNVQSGGVSYFGNYKQWIWEPVSDCKECYKYRK